MTDSRAAVPVTGIDHMVIGVADLEGSRAQWQKLGFTLTPRGKHIGWGTANYCIMFPDDYLELLGIVDPAQFVSGLDEFLASGEGIMGLAFATRDADAVIEALASRGVGAEGPKDLKRYLELPGGNVEPAFRLVHPAADATPDLWAFICQHVTPDLIRQAPWLDHANGATGIHSVTIVVDDPLAHRTAYERLFGHGAIIVTDATLVVRVGAHRLVFVAPDDVELMHPAGSLPGGAKLPHTLALTIRCRDISVAANCLDSSSVPHRRLADGTLAVSPTDANGVLLEFKAG